MNNKTVEKFEFVVKLREDRVWDLYLDGIWVGSCGNVDSVLKAEKSLIEEVLSKTEKRKGRLVELMEKSKEQYINYFSHMQEEDNKSPLCPMAWDNISWWIYEATEKDKLFTLEELADMFPDLLGYLKKKN